MASGWRWVIGGALAAMLAAWAGQAPAQSGPVKMEWFSWSIFRFTSPGGKVIVTNPFVKNPDSPVKVEDFPKVDAIVVADGHTDEVGSTDRGRPTSSTAGRPWGSCSTSRTVSPSTSPGARR